MAEEYDYLLKICIVCYPDELLTQSLRSYADLVFGPPNRSISGFTILIKNIKIDNNSIRLILVDLSTSTSFLPRCLHYFQGAFAAVFAFSKTCSSFFKSVIDLYNDREIHKWLIFNPSLPVAFIGLCGDSEAVTAAEGEKLAHKLGADYFETATTDLQTLDTVLMHFISKILSQKLSDKVSTNKFYGLYHILPWEAMIKIIEEAEGDPILKKELLEDIAFKRKEAENLDQRFKELFADSLSVKKRVNDVEFSDVDGYEDYNERVHIFKKRLAILIKSDKSERLHQ